MGLFGLNVKYVLIQQRQIKPVQPTNDVAARDWYALMLVSRI